ncbi:MAG: ABC transporter permease [Candidatus Babeliales bacterium]
MRFFKNFFPYLLPIFVAGAYVFLYAPILVLVVFSFNSVAFPYHWVSFSTKWYVDLFQSPEIWEVTKNSLIVACTSSMLSLLMALLFVFYGVQTKLRSAEFIFYINILIPEIVLALGLLIFFTYCSVPLGLITLIVGHTVLGLGFAVPILSNRFAEVDYSIIEAAYDLGATLNQTFLKIIVPMLMPALVAAGLLVFIISLDDFLISFFCAGGSAQTLSLYIFSMIRSGISPTINALSTLLLLVSSTIVLLFSLLKVKTRVF